MSPTEPRRTPLTILLHGESGSGKSWLADTTPGPRLILDVEGRSHFLPSQPKIEWDPVGPPPELGDWETCVVHVRNPNVLDKVYQWLASGQHPFKSVVIDSLMEVQKRFIDDIAGTDQMKTQDWGNLLRKLESNIRSFRDMASNPHNGLDIVVFITGTVVEADTGLRRPLLQGQIKLTLPYFVDVVGFIYIAGSEANPMQMVRHLLVQNTGFAVAKDATGQLGGPSIEEPNLTTIYTNLTTKNEVKK
mgnify:CR=1 FL=1